MKKTLIALTAALTAIVSAQEETNLLENGGFEKVSKIAKASDKYIVGRIKQGWDFGMGPVAKIPANWVPNVATGKVKLRIVTIGENGENKENVTEGKNALHISGEGFHLYNSRNLKPGKYKFSFKYKGSGRVTICFYCYKKDPKTGRGVHLTSNAPMTAMAKAEWQTYTREMEIGKWNPEITHCTFALTGTKADLYIDDMKVIPVVEGQKK